MWKLTRDETNYGIPQRALRGHSHFVSDVVISSDGQFALSGSWDGTLRLWDLTTQVAALGPCGRRGELGKIEVDSLGCGLPPSEIGPFVEDG